MADAAAAAVATNTDKKALAVALGLLEGTHNDNNGDASSFAGLPPLFQPIPSPDPQTTSSYVYPPSAFPPPSTFEVSIRYHALLVPKKRTQQILKKLKDVMIHRPRLRVVLELSQEDDVHLLPPLPGVANNNANDRSDYRKIVLKFPVVEEESRPSHHHHHPAIQTIMAAGSGEAVWARHTLTFSYDDWTAEEVLRRLLPSDEIPSAMEQVGHLAHVNLRDDLLPFKYLIGKVLLDKNKGLKTIVNKVGTIETEYRTFGMEVIAGDDAPGWSEVTVKEEGCHYILDFQRVYWNSRLGREHQRIVKRIRKDANNNNNNDKKLGATTIVADLMAGIGPFAIPLTAEHTLLAGEKNGKMVNENTGIVVYANDLNPASFEYLTINAERNRCGNRLHTYNMDARAFCHKLQDEGIAVDHFIMNLPKTALEFLDAFRGYKVATVGDKRGPDLQHQRPWIHVHCFASKDPIQSQKEIWDRCEAALGCSLDKSTDQVAIHEVRDVAPNKNMYCVSFRLPTAAQSLPRIAFESSPTPKEEEPDAKRSKLS